MQTSPRREFLSRFPLAVAGSVLAVGAVSGATPAPPAVTESPAPPLPTIRLGDHHVTRLIAGSNPISGYSYMGPIMDRHMREYFTPERIVEFLGNCERAGINTHQFSDPEPDDRRHSDAARARVQDEVHLPPRRRTAEHASVEQVVRDTQPIAIVHHGGVTDRLFRRGQEPGGPRFREARPRCGRAGRRLRAQSRLHQARRRRRLGGRFLHDLLLLPHAEPGRSWRRCRRSPRSRSATRSSPPTR